MNSLHLSHPEEYPPEEPKRPWKRVFLILLSVAALGAVWWLATNGYIF